MPDELLFGTSLLTLLGLLAVILIVLWAVPVRLWDRGDLRRRAAENDIPGRHASEKKCHRLGSCDRSSGPPRQESA